ncbi:leucyl aminopeptidase [Occultella glacieicola]|uniref:Probable cytosol aminopeptidase n=1 Tax=Occultella glacieicola TaxID=2518684 RepID=A0ABY2E7E1_9MICO|nr:leucyl aminopeptidase [Occultella glacieicola]TDE95964.1 leucyl aminopeptidase [Occultella glacieicola]
MSNPTSIFTPASLTARSVDVTVTGLDGAPEVAAHGIPVSPGVDVPALLGLDRDALSAVGFTGAVGETLVLPGTPIRVAYGTGPQEEISSTSVRDAAAACSLAVSRSTALALDLPGSTDEAGAFATAAVEGALLARYSYRLGRPSPSAPLAALMLRTGADGVAAAEEGARRGQILVRTAERSRDLANAPGGALTAARFAELATEIGASAGLRVEVFDEAALRDLGCGGLLGVNLGSVDPPRMVKLTYEPSGTPSGRLTLVGKGIMYDSGGIALKPGDLMHAAMKNDMTGAGAILAAMTALGELDCPTQVTGFLMCTDNMPSGSAMKLGDVLTIRGGTTVEVLNTDAEGRLVMADALVLATEEPTDAIVDIATLTGACMRALGTEIAGVMGNDSGVIDQVRHAGERVDEPVWELPLARRYRKELDSTIADLKNLGGPNAGAITAALFLEEFVDGRPWAHLDIAGTAQADAANGWRNKGATGFGARLLVDLALNFTAPGR